MTSSVTGGSSVKSGIAGGSAAKGAIAVPTGPAAFDPRSIPNLELWLDAWNVDGNSNQSLVEGAAIATWKDLSGKGRDASQPTAGRRPVLRLAALPNGRPALQFDGIDDWIGSADTSTIAGPDRSAFVVASSLAAGVGGYLLDSASAVNRGEMAWDTAGNSSRYLQAAGAIHPSPASDGVPHVFSGVATGGGSPTAQHFRDAVVGAAGAWGGTPMDGFTVGARSSRNSQMWPGFVSVIAVYSRPLTAAELLQVSAYLKTRCGTP